MNECVTGGCNNLRTNSFPFCEFHLNKSSFTCPPGCKKPEHNGGRRSFANICKHQWMAKQYESYDDGTGNAGTKILSLETVYCHNCGTTEYIKNGL